MEPKMNVLVLMIYVLPCADGCYVIFRQSNFSHASAVSQHAIGAKFEIPILKPMLASILSQILPINRDNMQKESGFYITNLTMPFNVNQRVGAFTEIHIETMAE